MLEGFEESTSWFDRLMRRFWRAGTAVVRMVATRTKPKPRRAGEAFSERPVIRRTSSGEPTPVPKAPGIDVEIWRSFATKSHLPQRKKYSDLCALVVAKGGPRLKHAATADGPLPEAPQPGTIARAALLDRDGFPQLPAGRSGFRERTENGVTRWTFRMAAPNSCRTCSRVFWGGVGR